MKFGVFADLHVDIMPNGQVRLEKFLEDCRKENVDFIIQLGDFCYPDSDKCVCKPENRPENIQNALDQPMVTDKKKIIDLYKNFEKPSFHVVGNHDCDLCSKREVLDFYGADYEPYYSFDMCGYHLVVLDCNYFRVGNEYFDFDHGNYFDCPSKNGTLPWMPEEELDWLENDLKNAKFPSILFSHQRLLKGSYSILNADELEKILLSAPKGVIMSLNGHEHMDEMTKQNGIWYYNVNSMSNYWVGDKYAVKGRYGEEYDEKYPNLQYVIPYKEAVYSIVTIDDNEIKIDGRSSTEVGINAKEMGLEKGKSFYGCCLREDITAESKSRILKI